jgi:hypothetical protein
MSSKPITSIIIDNPELTRKGTRRCHRLNQNATAINEKQAMNTLIRLNDLIEASEDSGAMELKIRDIKELKPPMVANKMAKTVITPNFLC